MRFPAGETVFSKRNDCMECKISIICKVTWQKTARAVVLNTQFDSVRQTNCVNSWWFV